MLSVGDPWLSSTCTKRYWKVGGETTQCTGDTFVRVEEGPGADEVTLNPVNTGKLDVSEMRPEIIKGRLQK